jgi:glycosyltransferase involved in cell wall biosynthesis
MCYEWPPLGGGGGRVAADIARGLAKKGHTVAAVTSALHGLQRRETIDGVAIRRVFAGRRRADRCTVPEMAIYVLTQPLPVLFEVLRFRPDVIHVHFAVPTGPVAWFATRFVGIPYVLTVHLGDVPGGVPEQTDHLYRIVKPFTVPIWRSAAAVIAVAPHVAELANRAYGISPQVILNGSDAIMVRRSGEVRNAGPLRVVWCGRIQQQKNLAAAISGLASIAGQAWTLDILGDGPLRAEAEETGRRSGLSGQTRFHGWVEPSRVAAEFGHADVLFLPSLAEGLSLVTVEALRAGLAFVASGVRGITDVVVHGRNGILCDPRTPSSFAAAFMDLIGDREKLRAMQVASAERAAMFGTEAMVDAYERVLADAAQPRTCR